MIQRALSYTLAPAPGPSLRMLLAAPWFAVLAALVVLVAGAPALDSRWSPPMLAATHLMTIGCLSLAMAGSLLQLIPVVAGNPIAPLAGRICFPSLTAGALLLAAGFLVGAPWLFACAAAVLALGFGALAAFALPAALRACPSGALPMVRGIRLALPALGATAAMGIALALFLAGGPALPAMLVASLHAGWGLVGWVAALVVCVSFQVIPMFQTTPAYPAVVARAAPIVLVALLLAWSGAQLAAPALETAAAVALALLLAGFAILTLGLLLRRKRADTDTGTRYWRLALACLAASPALYLCGAEPLLIGITFVGGFAMSAVNGMLYKIVPFLLWYHLQQDPRKERAQVPSVKNLLPDAQARRQFWWHACALALLLCAVRWPLLARPASLVFGAASTRLGLDLYRAARMLQP